MFTKKQMLLIVAVFVAIAALALAVSWATSFGVEVAWFDGGSLLGRCIGSTCTSAG